MSLVTEFGDRFIEILRRELARIPLRQWGYFFPCYVATWRFVELQRPGVFGELRAGFDTEPYFLGKGSEWLVENLAADETYLSLIETIMYSVSDALPKAVFERGVVKESELPSIDPELGASIAELILNKFDSDLAVGAVR